MQPLPDLKVYDTYPKLLAWNAERYGGDVAMREKDYGIWNPITWADYHAKVKAMALGLLNLGAKRGDVIGLLGKNRPNWIFAEIAAHAVGGMSLGIYEDVIDQEAKYLIAYSDVRFIFVEDEEQVDKLLGLEGEIPTVEAIIYNDPRGMRKYDDPRLIPLADLMARGEALDAEQPKLYAETIARGTGEDVAVLCTTSGTTSNPKLAMLQAGPFLGHCAAYLEADPKGAEDEYVSVLPLPWIMEQVYAVAQPLICRIRVNFVEEGETMMADMREIAPTFVLFAPRVWEGIAADVRARMMDSSPLKRAAFDAGMKLGLAALDQGRRSPLADMLLFRALRDRLGFTHLKSAATGGAALGPDTFRFFLAMGVPLRQLYGQTELAGAYTVHRADDVDFETVGTAFRNTEIRIDNPDPNGLGAIVTRHTGMFAGYYRNDEATEGTMDGEWLVTGDAGYFDDKNHLVVIDRMSDLATTANGTRFSPQYLENKLKFSTFVGEAVVLGHNRPFLAAMLCIRYSIVSKWAEKNRITFTTYTDLASRPEVYDLVRAELLKVNDSLPEAQRIRRFVLLYKELDPDDGELTRTRKVRREVINDRYGEIIDAIYQGRDSVHVDTTITFQDGTKQRIRTDLRIVDLIAPETEKKAA
ncbi:MAG: long-chain fatty acid--CoA ligase [Rhodospirillaceae bacterium]|nr:long-chain fatty acid--CoA ligase [Rhodospirillaceae bacterium]